MVLELLKILLPTMMAFLIGLFITPFASHFFYKYKLWKKKTRTADIKLEVFKEIHIGKEDAELSVPCVGGTIVWISVFLTTLLFFLLAIWIPDDFFSQLNFFSRSQTVLPLGILLVGSLVGIIDDIFEIKGKSDITRNSHFYTWTKIFTVILIGLWAGYWFYFKLGMESIHIPFGGYLYLGILMIPFVAFILFSTFSTGVIDGIDGLSGGVLASIFGAYSVIAFTNNQLDLAALSGVITGAILAFLWFNIPPARFYMGETGIMGLTITLATLALLTDSVLLLPVVAMPLVLTSLSVIIQIISKKFRYGKRVFKVAPLHHHFEAIGWPPYKVVMRYWIFSLAFAIIGIILFVISK